MAVHNKINRKKFLAASALTLSAMITVPAAANADDSHAWVFENGGGSFSTDISLPNTTTITQTTDRAIGIGNTNIAGNQTVNILQNGAGSLFVAKDNTGNASAILGRLNANGGVVVLNENGVVFGKDATLNVGSIVASTARDITFHDDGTNNFDLSNFGNGAIVNNGMINVTGAGLAALVAPSVVNNGIISAKLGKVVLAAGGEKATVDLYGDGLIELTLGNSKAAASIENAGTVEGKTVLMTAAAAKDVVDTVINMSGVVKASSVTEEGGKIVLNGGSSGKVVVSGTVEANGATKGGNVSVKGNDVYISGIIHADGDLLGGNVEIVGDKRTYFTGYISALGANGFVETSGDLLGIHGSVVTGEGGEWLLDPTDIRIVSGTGNGGDFNPDDSADDSWYWLGADYIINALNAGTSVTIQTSAQGDRAGDIVVDAAILKSSGNNASLTLNAINDIYVNQQISSTSKKLNVNLNAGVGTTNADADVYVYNNILSNGGNVKINALDDIDVANNAVIRTGVANGAAGNVVLDAQGLGGAGNPSYVWMTTGGRIETAADIGGTAGNVTINTQNFHLADAGTHIFSGAGNININNTGVFDATADSLGAVSTGKISVNQNVGTTWNGAASSIQNAVDAVHNNDSGLKTITVGDGTFTENVTLADSNTTLKSENGRDATTINGVSNIGALGSVVIGNNANNVTLGGGGHGFTINGIDNGVPGIENAAVYLQGNHSNTTIKGNTIVAQGDEALVTEYGLVNDTLDISNNRFEGKTYVGATYTDGDQFVDPNVPRQLVALNNGISNLTFNNNVITGDSGLQHLVAVEANGAVISGNKFNGLTTATDLRLRGSNITVSDNKIDGNNTAENAIWASNVNGLTINGGNDIHNADTGIYATNVNALVINGANTIHDATSFGIYLDGGTPNAVRALIDGNTISGIGAHAIHTRDNQYATITNNVISDTDVGITTENFSQSAADGQVTLIDGNTISAKSIGIRNNLSYGTQSGFQISNNTITAEDPSNTRRWTGIDVVSQMGGVATNFVGNNIDGSAVNATRQTAGYELTNMTNANRAVINGGTVKNVDVGVWATDGSFYTGAVNDLLVENVSFENIGEEGILVEDTTDANNQTGVNATTTHVTVGNNTYTNTAHNVAIAGAATVALSGNGLTDVLVKAAGPAHYVGSPYGTTTQLTTGNASINAGIALAADAGTVNVEAGTFDEDVVVNKAVYLKGNNAGISAADGSVRNAETIITPHSPGFHITASNATVDGFTVESPTGADGYGVWVDNVSNASVLNNIVNSPSGIAGLYVVGSSNALLQGNAVNNSLVDSIRVIGGTGTQILGNKLTNSGTVFGVNGDGSGIVLVNADNVDVDNNDINNAARIGVYAGGSSNITINNNRMSNIGTGTNTAVGDSIGQWAGVHVEGTNNVAVTNNTINGTTGEGVNIGGFINPGLNGGATGTVNVAGNTINNTGKDGVLVKNTNSATILGNQIGLLGGANSIGTAAGGGDAIFVTNADGTVIQSNKTANTHYNGPARKGSGILVTNSDNVQIGGAGVLGNDVALAGSDGIVVRTDGGTADHNTIEGNTIHGIAGSRTGIYTENATNTAIKNNTVSGTGRYAAIYGYGGSGFDISGNTLNHNDEEGILLQNAGGVNKITGNTIDNTGENLKTSDGTNVGDAIHVQGTSGLTVSGNTIGKNGGNIRGDGVYVTGSNGAAITGNTINDTKFTTADANGSNGSGIQVVNTDGATIGGAGVARNTITNAQWDGIRLQNDSNITVSNNSVDTTGRVNIWGGNINTASILNNVVNHDGLGGYGSIHADGGSSWTVSGNTVNNGDYGIFLNGVGGTNLISGNKVGTPGFGGITADGIRALGTSGLTISGNIIGDSVFTGADGIHVENSAGVQILNNYAYNTYGAGVFVQGSDNAVITGNDIESVVATSGIDVVNSDNVQIKTNNVGSVFPGSFPGNGIVVEGGSDKATVDGNNVNVKSGGNGVLIKGGVTQTVSNNTVNGGSRGILLDGTGNGASVSGNTVGQTTGSNNNGIELANAGTATVSGNHVYNAGWDGINVNGGNAKVTVSGNDVHNSIGASGIVFYNHNGGGLIDNNTVENSARLGIYNGFSNDVTISNNTVTNSGTANVGTFTDAIFVEGANNAVIDSNKINTATGNGIRVGGVGNAGPASTTGLNVKNNKVANTGSNGISVQDSAGAKVTDNRVGYLSNGTTLAGAGNIKGDGISVVNSGASTISGNKTSDTLGNGIFLDPSDGSVIAKNTIDKAGLNGIYVLNSSNVTVGGASADKNTITNSGSNGIKVEGGSGNTVKNNSVKTSANDGVLALNTTKVTIDTNAVDGAGWIGIELNNADGLNAANQSKVIGNTVKNAKDGIDAAYSDYLTIGGTGSAKNTISNMTFDGIKVDYSNSVTVDGNDISAVGDNGIEADNDLGLVIKRNVIKGTGNDGIHVTNAAGVVIGGTSTSDANKIGASGASGKIGGDGIHVENSASSIIRYNQITNTTDDGIFLDPSDDSVIASNTISNVGGDGIESADNDRVTIGGATAADGNTITVAGANGINVHGGVSALIQNNTVKGGEGTMSGLTPVTGALGAQLDGIHVVDNAGVKVLNNTVTNGKDKTITIPLLGTYGALGGNATGGNGVYVQDSNNAQINNNTIKRVGDDGVHVENSNATTISHNTVDTAADDGIYLDPSDDSVISSNTISNVGGDGIESADNDRVTIGGSTAADGNTITGAGAHGINVHGGVDALVQNNTVKGGDAVLVLFDGADGAQLDGIHVVDNNGVRILANTITAGQGLGMIPGLGNGGNGANGNGVYVQDSDNAVIDQNIVSGDLLGNGVGAVADGIHVENSNNLTVGGLMPVLNGNKIFSTGGDGVSVDGSTGLLVLNNIIGVPIPLPTPLMDVAGDGVTLNNTLGSLVAGNIITQVGGDGIRFTNGGLAGIGLNLISNSGLNGIEIGNSALIAVGLNQINGTGKNGIEIDNALLALIADNDISNTTEDGINARFAAALLITGNTIKSTGDDGVDAAFVALTGINDNTIDDTANDGIRLAGALGATVNGNTISNAGGNGVNASLAYGLDINNNDIRHVGSNGIATILAASVNINDNVIDDTGYDGIGLAFALDANVNGNTVTNAANNGIEADFVYDLDVSGNKVDSVGGSAIAASYVAKATINNNLLGLSGPVLGNGVDLRNSALVTISGNDIGAVSGNGIFVDPSFNITIDNNDVNGAGVDGIHVEDTNGLIISNNRVDGSGDDGVEVHNSDKVQLLSNLISNSGSRGLYVSGQDNGSVVLKGNVFTDNPTGAEFETGEIDLTGLGLDANTFNGGDVAMLFDPTAKGDPHKLVLVGDTIGETAFNGQTTFYVQLANGAFFDPGTPTILDGFHATYDGFRPDTVPYLTLAQYNAIESKIYHYNDDPTLGLFFFGTVPDIDQKDLLKEFGAFGGTAGKFRITITGMPKTGGTGGSFTGGGNIANLLASINPAAGGNDKATANTKGKKAGVADIANIEPAAGVDTPAQTAAPANNNTAGSDTACWSQAVAKASSGAPVDYSFGGSMEEAIAQTAACGSGSQF